MIKKRHLFFAIYILSSFLSIHLQATITVTYPIADSMVVQRNMKVPIWGQAAVGETVSVSFNGQTKSTVTASNGKWRVDLDSMSAAGPLNMTISGTNTVSLKGIYVGEVWNCAGQSNMDLRLNDYVSNNYNASYADTIKNARNPMLRYIDVRYTQLGKNKGWHAITPSTAGGCSSTAYFYGKILQRKLGCAVGLLVTAVGGTYIEGWLDPATLAANPLTVYPSGYSASDAGGLYNTYVAPVIPFGIKGTVCMHGEQNAGDSLTAPLYGKRFESLIKGWRTAWGQGDFPFYYGQITMYNSKAAVDSLSPIIQVREGQRCAQKVVNTGMTVNTDLSASQWHFGNKYEAGRRLALLALNRTYGYTELESTGPVFESMGTQGYIVRLHFSHVGTGLTPTTPTCFYVAGSDNVWYSANAVVSGDELMVGNTSVLLPRKVCYGYGKTPYSNFYNKDGFPASEFMSDNLSWPDGGKSSQILSFPSTARGVCGQADITPAGTTTSGLPITYTSSDSTIAKITSDGKIHLTGGGTCTIKAFQSGNATYRASITLSQTLTVTKATQTVTFDTIPMQTYGNVDWGLKAVSTSGLPITYTSSDTTVAKITANMLRIRKAGTSTIKATQSGTAFYSAANLSRPLTVSKATLLVQAADTTRSMNALNPAFRLIYSGFVGTDTPASLLTVPTASCVADVNSTFGTYPIVVGGGSDVNYNFSYINGTLNVLNNTDVRNTAAESISIYPTLVSDHISINVPGAGYTLTITNMQGAVLYKQALNAGPNLFTEHLLKGIYLVRISDTNDLKVMKVIIQ